MSCPLCESEIPSDETECVECGSNPEVIREIIIRARALGWIIGLMLGVAVSFACLVYAGDSAFFFSVWILPPVLGAIVGEIVKSFRLDRERDRRLPA